MEEEVELHLGPCGGGLGPALWEGRLLDNVEVVLATLSTTMMRDVEIRQLLSCHQQDSEIARLFSATFRACCPLISLCTYLGRVFGRAGDAQAPPAVLHREKETAKKADAKAAAVRGCCCPPPLPC